MRVGRGAIGDDIEIKEAGTWDAPLEVGGAAGALLWIVGEKPGSAEGNEARCGGGGRGGDGRLESSIEFLR